MIYTKQELLTVATLMDDAKNYVDCACAMMEDFFFALFKCR